MLHLRAVTEADLEAVSTIRVRGWRSAYAGIVPRAYLDAMSVEDDVARRREWFARPDRQATDLVAVEGGLPVGWISFGPRRGPGSAASGEVYALYVLPGLTGRGIGRALLTEAHGRMERRPFDASTLWVLAGNHGARRFYERQGYRADGRTQDDVYDDGTTLTELSYRRALRASGV